HALGLPIRGTPLRPTEHHTPGSSGGNARLYPLADQVALELGQASPDGAQELAAGRRQIEAKPSLRQEAHFPDVQVVKGLHQVLVASTPSAQRRDGNGIDHAGLGKCHALLALRASVVGLFFFKQKTAYEMVAGSHGEGAQVSFLALTRLVVGAHAAVNRGLSQLNPLTNLICQPLKLRILLMLKSVSENL